MTEPKVDWRTCPAGRELDKLIAERLGWRVEDYNAPPRESMIKTINSWMILGPGEDAKYWISHSHHGYVTAEQAWDALLEGSHWSTSVDAALSLVNQKGVGVTFSQYYGSPTWMAAIVDEVGKHIYDYHRADTPAEAIVKAFLAWKDAQ